MKHLAVLRHAKSSWGHPNLDDFDRPLNERGWKAARRMGRELKNRRMRFDFGLASPAARVRETLDGVADGYGEFPFAVRFEPQIYLATVTTLLELVRGIDDETRAALIVGHNPGLHELVLELTSGSDLRARVEAKFPTAALAVIALPADHWSDVGESSGELAELILPKELD